MSLSAGAAGLLRLSPAEWDGVEQVVATIDGAAQTLDRTGGGFELTVSAGDHVIELAPGSGGVVGADSGCGCKVGGSEPSPSGGLLLLACLAGLRLVRRRRGAPPQAMP